MEEKESVLIFFCVFQFQYTKKAFFILILTLLIFSDFAGMRQIIVLGYT